MNALWIHLGFLRPLRSFVAIALYTVFAGTWARHLFDLDLPTALLVTLNVAFPLLAGSFVAGACHEPLHRAFALTLPGIRIRQLKAAALGTGAVTLLATIATLFWSRTPVSPAASFGLAFALAALPAVNRYHRWGGQAGVLAMVGGWLLLCALGGAKLLPAMSGFPALFLIGGLAGGTVALAAGFSRESTRARAGILFIAPQTALCAYFFRPGMMPGWQAEKLARQNPRPDATLAQAWTSAAVDTNRGWWAVLWHAQFGRAMHGSFLRLHLRVVIACIGGALALGAVTSGFSSQLSYWQLIAQCVAPDREILRSVGASNVGGNFALMLPGMATLYVLIQLSPPIHFPISRRRLAEIAFRHALQQWALALTLPATGLLLLSGVGQILSGAYRPAFGVLATLAVVLPLAALLPWLLVTGTIRRPAWRILATVPVGIALMVITMASPLTHLMLTAWGVVTVTLMAAAGLALLQYRLHRDYASADLTKLSGLAQFANLPRPGGI